MLDLHKYCLCDECEIINYLKNNEIIKVNLNKEFKYKFVFKNTNEAINTFKETIINLINLVDKYYDIKYEKKRNNKLDENIFVYKYEKEKNIISKENINNELLDLGFKFIQNYDKIKDFYKFEHNQPFSFKHNNVLYITFLINEIYKYLLSIDEDNIKINEIYFTIINELGPFLDSIIADINNNKMDDKLFYKIRAFNMSFEAKKCDNFSNLNTNFNNHFLLNNITDKEVDNFIKFKQTQAKISRIKKREEYIYKGEVLTIKNEDGTIKFNIKEYNSNLFKEIYYKDELLKYTWECNSLKDFQTNNFLTNEDIEFLKHTIRKILKSKFWADILDTYCDIDFIEKDIFKMDDFIDQFLKRIIFMPFDIKDLGFFAFTTCDDLYVFISGYPYDKNVNPSLKNYNLGRIFQLGVSVIIIMHEAIHYTKRLFSFITCNMISGVTIIEDEREEGGNLLEEILFGWKTDDKNKEINLVTALNLLNSKIYDGGLENVKQILTKKEIVSERDDLLVNFLSRFNLLDKINFDNFIKKNRNKTVNASKESLFGHGIEYISTDHRNFGGWKKCKK